MDKGSAKDRQHEKFNRSGVVSLNQETPLEFHQMKHKILTYTLHVLIL